MTLLPTATPRTRPGSCGPRSPSGSGPWVLSCTPRRRRSCTARTRTAGETRSTPASTSSATPSGAAWPEGRRGYFTGFSPAISAKARKAKGQQIRAWHLNRRSGDGPVRPRPGDQPSGARLDQLLRSLLPLRVVLPRMAHQRAPRPMGHAEVQTTARQRQTGVGLAGRCSTAPAHAVRPLAPAPATQGGLWEPYDGRPSRTVCARHDQQLGGASPLWRLMAPTTSRWQLLSREAGWGGSRSAKSRP